MQLSEAPSAPASHPVASMQMRTAYFCIDDNCRRQQWRGAGEPLVRIVFLVQHISGTRRANVDKTVRQPRAIMRTGHYRPAAYSLLYCSTAFAFMIGSTCKRRQGGHSQASALVTANGRLRHSQPAIKIHRHAQGTNIEQFSALRALRLVIESHLASYRVGAQFSAKQENVRFWPATTVGANLHIGV